MGFVSVARIVDWRQLKCQKKGTERCESMMTMHDARQSRFLFLCLPIHILLTLSYTVLLLSLLHDERFRYCFILHLHSNLLLL